MQICKSKTVMIMGIAVVCIDLEEDFKDLDRLFHPADLFKGESFVLECPGTPLVEGNRIVECIDGVLVPPEVKERPPILDPALLLVRVNLSAF